MIMQNHKTVKMRSRISFERLHKISKEEGYYWVWSERPNKDPMRVNESFVKPATNSVITFDMPRGEA